MHEMYNEMSTITFGNHVVFLSSVDWSLTIKMQFAAKMMMDIMIMAMTKNGSVAIVNEL